MSRNDSKTPSISEKIAKLEAMVAWFESDEFRLEEAVDRYAEAEKLAEAIKHDLFELKTRVSVVEKDFSKE